MPLSAQDVAAKWAKNLTASQDSIRKGVQAVTTNPAERAIARKQAYLDGVQRAAAEGRYERGLRRVSLQSWQQAMLEKGLGRISQGASSGTPKMQQFMASFLPHIDAGLAKLSTMPRGDYAQNVQRALAMMDHLHQFQYNR